MSESITTLSLFSALAVEGAIRSAVLPAYESRNDVGVVTTFDPTTVLVRRIRAGETPDVVVLVSETIAELEAEGILSDGGTQQIAKVGVGVAIPSDTALPDISTVDHLVNALKTARSVAYSRSGASGIYFASLVERLGIAEEVNCRATVIEKGFTAEALKDGRADLAIQQLSELRFVDGVTVVGGLPAGAQHYTRFAVALSKSAGPEAEELRDAIAGEAAASAYLAAGLDPP